MNIFNFSMSKNIYFPVNLQSKPIQMTFQQMLITALPPLTQTKEGQI